MTVSRQAWMKQIDLLHKEQDMPRLSQDIGTELGSFSRLAREIHMMTRDSLSRRRHAFSSQMSAMPDSPQSPIATLGVCCINHFLSVSIHDI